jgi:hypothetical protein
MKFRLKTTGNKVDLELLKQEMLEAIIAGETEIDLAQTYQQPTLTADDPVFDGNIAEIE